MNQIESSAVMAQLEGAWTAFEAKEIDTTVLSQLPEDVLDALKEILRKAFAFGYRDGFTNGCRQGASWTIQVYEELTRGN